MRKTITIIIIFVMIFSSVALADPAYVGTWSCVFHASQDSTTFVMFQLCDDHTVLYVNQFFYNDHAGMTEKGVWKWEEIDDRYFRIVTDDNRFLYFELTEKDYLAASSNLFYTRFIEPEAN